jgi:hypothetical protein
MKYLRRWAETIRARRGVGGAGSTDSGWDEDPCSSCAAGKILREKGGCADPPVIGGFESILCGTLLYDSRPASDALSALDRIKTLLLDPANCGN